MAQAALPITHDAHGDHPAPSAGVTNTKLGMWVFLSSDCLFFGAFITTYLLYRHRNISGPTPRSLYNIPFTSVTSFILLMSSLTMVLALAAIQRGDMRRFKVWVMATAVFGATADDDEWVDRIAKVILDGVRPSATDGTRD